MIKQIFSRRDRTLRKCKEQPCHFNSSQIIFPVSLLPSSVSCLQLQDSPLTASKRTAPSSSPFHSPLLFLPLINLLPGDGVWAQRLYLSRNQRGTVALIEERDIPRSCRIPRSISFPSVGCSSYSQGCRNIWVATTNRKQP
jgi:hypothetical protein